MKFLGFLNHWWNFPFLVMLGLVAAFFVLQVFGILGHHGDVEAHGDVHADADADADHDHDHAGGSALAWFGGGRVPFMVVWVTLFIFAGFTGLFVNRLFFLAGEYPAWAFGVALVGSAVMGLAGVRVFAGLAARLVDTGGRGASTKHELAGKLGVVASAHLDDRFGEIRVHDARGTEQLVHARLAPGEAPLARGDKVVVVEYDADKELFWATASPVDAKAN